MNEVFVTSYDPLLVLLSYAVSVLGCYTALQVARYIPPRGGSDRPFWIASAAFAMGAGGVWSMHFIGMLAFDAGMPVSYDVPLTIGSLLLAVAATGAAFALVGSQGRSRLPAASALMGLGIAGMHYLGMAAMIMPAALSYRPGLVAASVAVAVAAAAASLELAARDRGFGARLGSALAMGLAVSGMHYTGMAAAVFHRDGQVFSDNPHVSPEVLAYAVFLLAVVVLSIQIGLSAGLARRDDALIGS